MAHLEPIDELLNNTVYQTQISRGIIASKALLWFGKNETEFIKYWNQTHDVKTLREDLKEDTKLTKKIEEMNDRANATIVGQ